ncbi:MAG: polyprenyl synthetase family protein [Chloroflexota bacterium]|nr:polyprenyl synthetase family protein [Chloroflexota bacterium]
MHDFLPQYGGAIAQAIERVLERKADELAPINPWGADVCARLKGFATRGKMLRGKLVVLSYLMFHDSIEPPVLDAAAAIELLHSSLLIHDDIMDRDLVRRGQPTVSAQYQGWGEGQGLSDPYHFGLSMGICAGDVAFFIALEILGSMEAAPSAVATLLALFAREITCVGVAQMQDVFLGSGKGAIDEEDIYTLYTYKTGRYTFSLPMMTGALLAGQGPDILSQLEAIGICLGIMYQIRDDELGLFGDEAELGKPVGSDLQEEKQTLYYRALMERATDGERERLSHIVGKQGIAQADMDYVRRLIAEHGIKRDIDERVAQLASRARGLIASLDGVHPESRACLLDLLEYSVSRER